MRCAEWPVLRTAFLMAEDLFQATNPGSAAGLGIGPGFDELLELIRRHLDNRVRPLAVDGAKADPRDVGIYHWRRQAIDVLETALRGAGAAETSGSPSSRSKPSASSGKRSRPFCRSTRSRPPPGTSGTPSR